MDTKSKILVNLFWRFLERCGAQCVTFFVSIILARLLDPSVYGTVALVSVFISIIQVFVDSGLGTALIQKKDADDLDYSTVFITNILICFFLFFILFLSAPFIAYYYQNQDLTPIIRVAGLTIIISGIKNVQQAYVSKNMLFKKFFYATLTGTISAAIIGIFLAWKGYGVWALVIQNLINQSIDTLFLWFSIQWKPQIAFSFHRLKCLFSFGWKMLVSSLLATTYNELRSLIIGKKYASSDLAYYNQGQKFPKFIITNINSSIDSVLLPTLAAEQDSKDRIREMTKKAISTSTYLIMPLMTILAVCAEPLVKIILTQKWLPCVFFLRIYCFSYALYPIHTANLNAIQAIGRSDVFLIIEIFKKIIGITAILITMNISVDAMAYSLLFTSIISQIINSWPNKKLLNYSYCNQIKDIFPQIILSAIMGIIIFLVSLFPFNDYLILFLQLIIGIIVYFGLSLIFHVDSFDYILSIIRKLKN